MKANKKFLSAVCMAVIIGGSGAVYAAPTTPTVKMHQQADDTVVLKLENLNDQTIRGLQIDLEATTTLGDNIVFQGKNEEVDSFIKVNGQNLTFYFVDDEPLFDVPTIELGYIKGLGNIEFLEAATIKVVDEDFAATEWTDVQLEYIANSESNTDTETKPDTGTDTDTETKPDTGTSTKPNTKPNTKPSTKPSTKPETQPELTPDPIPEFVDTTGHWAEKDIQKMVQKGILKGYEDGTFKPNASMTRAELATVIDRIFNFDEKLEFLPFADVEYSKWYTKAVNNLYVRGIVNGRLDGTFGLVDHVTNQEAVVMLYRTLESLDIQLEKQRSYTNFKDQATISTFAKDAVQNFYEAGIISGTPEGNFYPQQSISRAQIAIMANRILEKLETVR